MSRQRTTAAAMAAAALLALPLAGCGKDKPKIPSSDADALVRVLGAVKRQADAQSCTTVEQTLESLERRVEALPARTDEDIQSSLRDGVANLRELVASECAGAVKKPKTESTETTTSEPSTTSEPETTTNTNTETTTETTNTTPDTNTNTTPQDGNTTPTPPSGGVTVPGEPKKKAK